MRYYFALVSSQGFLQNTDRFFIIDKTIFIAIIFYEFLYCINFHWLLDTPTTIPSLASQRVIDF